MVIGHKQILDFFEKATENNTLSHAYCFSGVDRIGKKTVAKQIASNLLKKDFKKLETSLDFIYLTRVIDEKTGKLKKDLSVLQIRELRSQLQMMSWGDGYKVVVIDESENLSEKASNALLKILEEPGEKTIFFLISRHVEFLLETIRSRCQTFHLAPLSDKELEKGLVALNYNQKQIEEILPYVNGRVGLAIDLLDNEDLFNDLKKTVKDCNSLISMPVYERFEFLNKYLGGKKEEARGKEDLKKDIDFWILEIRRVILEKISKEKQDNIKIKQLGLLLDEMQKAKKLVSKNINPKLLIENLFLN